MTLKTVLVALIFTPVIAHSTEFAKCNLSGTQLEMNACAADELAEADLKLNEVYNALLKREAKNVAFIQKLRAAQRSWLAFRDAELEAMYACEEQNQRICWGSMLPKCYSSYKAKLTRERTRRLQQFLDEGQPADECH